MSEPTRTPSPEPKTDMNESPEAELFASLIYLADSLVNDFDVVDLLDRLVQTCLSRLEVSAAGVLLANQRGALQVLASSSEETRLLEALEVQSNDGPCFEAFVSGRVVSVDDLKQARGHWPKFTPAAQKLGITASYAIPMRLRDQVIGALNLFCSEGSVLSERDLRMAGTLTSMAAIGIITHRRSRDVELLAEQLQGALNSRITIEQAKGIIAERESVDMEAAFAILRDAARGTRRPLTVVATEVAQTRQVPRHQQEPSQHRSTQAAPAREGNQTSVGGLSALGLGVEAVLGFGETRLE